DFAQSNRKSAEVLRDQVDDVLGTTGAQRVDIVAHSMGGLVTRWYLKFLGGTGKVDHFVSFGSPHHGTVVAGLCSLVLTSCKEMQRNSDFLNELDSGDETPGDVEYTTLTSSCDELVLPHSSSALDGADNRDVGCVEHA